MEDQIANSMVLISLFIQQFQLVVVVLFMCGMESCSMEFFIYFLVYQRLSHTDYPSFLLMERHIETVKRTKQHPKMR